MSYLFYGNGKDMIPSLAKKQMRAEDGDYIGNVAEHATNQSQGFSFPAHKEQTQLIIAKTGKLQEHDIQSF